MPFINVLKFHLISTFLLDNFLNVLTQEDLIPKGHNVLIFSQTRKMLNLIQVSPKVVSVLKFGLSTTRNLNY